MVVVFSTKDNGANDTYCNQNAYDDGQYDSSLLSLHPSIMGTASKILESTVLAIGSTISGLLMEAAEASRVLAAGVIIPCQGSRNATGSRRTIRTKVGSNLWCQPTCRSYRCHVVGLVLMNLIGEDGVFFSAISRSSVSRS